MEAPGSSILTNNGERIALERLLDAFSSFFSLEEIASTYCKAGQNADLAEAILHDLHKSTSISSTGSKTEKSSKSFCINALNGEVKNENCFGSSNSVTQTKLPYVNGRSKTTKPRTPTVSVGTVSSVLGENSKPLKMESKDFTVPQLWREESSRSSSNDDNIDSDIGGGVQLDKDLVLEVNDGDDSYRALRTSVKEYRATMKEYYKAAVEASNGGDRVRAEKLLEQGHFFHSKASEADEESIQKIFDTRNAEIEDAICLDLHDHTAKEAIRLLKCHLSSLCGIPSMKYLKVIIETNEEDISRGARKRLIIKVLEKDSIKWIEEESGGTILICLDEINPKKLSFSGKK